MLFLCQVADSPRPVEKVRMRKLKRGAYGAWLDVQPSDLGLRSFKARLQLEHFLSVSVISERDVPVETRVGPVDHEGKQLKLWPKYIRLFNCIC